MTKISFTCPQCGIWSSIPEDNLPVIDGVRRIVCKRCESDLTDRLVLGKMEVAGVTVMQMSVKEPG